MDVDGSEFGARLRACREAAGLSQQELADRSGLSLRAVSNMERGRTQWPYRNSLTRLADALGLREMARSEFLAAIPRRQLARPLPHGDLAGGSVAADRGVPQQLPARARQFIGRETELAELDRLLEQAGLGAPGTAVISAIGGTAGVGKTTLALTWVTCICGRATTKRLPITWNGPWPSAGTAVTMYPRRMPSVTWR